LPVKIMMLLSPRLIALSFRLSWFVPALTWEHRNGTEEPTVSSGQRQVQGDNHVRRTYVLELKQREKEQGEGVRISTGWSNAGQKYAHRHTVPFL
jgi:hypothetical protein